MRNLKVSTDDEEDKASAQARADRQSVNSIIQGTGADIAKVAMIRTHNKLVELNLADRSHLLLQIHDELIYEASPEVALEVLTVLQKQMEEAAKLHVHLGVSPKIGFAWGSMKTLSIIDEAAINAIVAARPPTPADQLRARLFEAWNLVHDDAQKLPVDSVGSGSISQPLELAEERLAFLQEEIRSKRDATQFLLALSAFTRFQIALTPAATGYGDEGYEYCVSKFGGCADTPAPWIDAYLTENLGRIPVSILQLDLARIPQKKHFPSIPETGMLYLQTLPAHDPAAPVFKLRYWNGGVRPDVDVVRVPPSLGFESTSQEPLTPLENSKIRISVLLQCPEPLPPVFAPGGIFSTQFSEIRNFHSRLFTPSLGSFTLGGLGTQRRPVLLEGEHDGHGFSFIVPDSDLDGWSEMSS